MSALGWPAVLEDGAVRLRPMRRGDARAWRSVRAANASWLQPWESRAPDPGSVPPSFAHMVRAGARAARAGSTMPFALDVDDRFSGQVTVSGITWGSFRSCSVGYWIDRRVAGRGHVPTALALVADHCFRTGLHRVEVSIRPENAASLRVVEKLHFRPEGLRRRLLHIDGDWRDHLSFALLAEDAPPGGVLAGWRSERVDSGH